MCGPAHLALHRPHTKCLPFRVAELPGRGRGLVATRSIRASRRLKFIVADTPGHEQYTRNMATGASTCDLAVLLVDLIMVGGTGDAGNARSKLADEGNSAK